MVFTIPHSPPCHCCLLLSVVACCCLLLSVVCVSQDDLADLDERLEIARNERYPDILRENLRKQLDNTELHVGKERAYAAKYHDLKWV